MSVATQNQSAHGVEDNGRAQVRVVRILARLIVGGPARHVVWLTAGLRPCGYDTTLVVGSEMQGDHDMIAFARDWGVEPWVIPEMSRELSIKDVVSIWKLYRLLCRQRPDIVHSHTAKAGAVGRIAGLLYRWLTPGTLLGRPRRCRFVHTYHGHYFHSYYGKLKTQFFLAIERTLARMTDRILVLSPQQLQEIHEQFRVGRREQFAIVPLGLDISAYAEGQSRRHILRRELGLADDDLLIAIVGRLTEVKNHSLFLRAAARLLEQRRPDQPRVRFVIVGDGQLRSALEAEAAELELGDHVTFLGNRHDLADLYPGADVVALTSCNEGTPLTLIEAMASGRAVVATAVGGVVDVVGHDETKCPLAAEGFSVGERGICVAPLDVDAFARALTRLCDDPELRDRLGRQGEDYVHRQYTKDRLIGDIDALYADLVPEQMPLAAP